MSPRSNRSLFRLLFPGRASARVDGMLMATEFERLFMREKALADRGYRFFSLVVLEPEDTSTAVLEQLAAPIREHMRAGDAFGRLDSRRVAVLLAGTDAAGAWLYAENLIARLAEADVTADVKVYADAPDKGSVQPGRRASDVQPPAAMPHGNLNAVHGQSPERGATNVREHGVGEAGSLGSPGGAREHSTASTPSEDRGDDDDSARGPQDDAPTGLDELAEQALEDIARQVRQDGALREPRGGPNGTQALRRQLERPIEDLELLMIQELPRSKRILDVVASGLALLFLSPILLVIALLVRLSSPGPIIFKQHRAGVGGQPFWFYKFRSMYIDAEARKAELVDENEKDGPIFKIKDDPRVTPIGKFIRRYSLDELPQLYNVLKGDMTLVGPRPPTMDEVEAYQRWQRQRLQLKGGLTCTWQVSGRSDVSFEDWMRMDAEYAQNQGLGTDLKLIAKTAKAIFTGKGAY